MQLLLNEQDKQLAMIKSPSQRARILTERWIIENVYCPCCGKFPISQHPNNAPVADFYCPCCKQDYELKSKRNFLANKILDGQYDKKIERLESDNNPSLFVLVYNSEDRSILNFFVIPKYFFVPETIEKRRPLGPNARRTGWMGSNILLDKVPIVGRIFLIQDGREEPKESVLNKWGKISFMQKHRKLSEKGWLLDIMRCIDKLEKQAFVLEDIYAFQGELRSLHPNNNNLKAKIRQSLQFLRDKGYLEFVERAKYKLI